jgi:hypothetical protein
MPWVELEPTIPVFERSKTFHALDRAAPVIGRITIKVMKRTGDFAWCILDFRRMCAETKLFGLLSLRLLLNLKHLQVSFAVSPVRLFFMSCLFFYVTTDYTLSHCPVGIYWFATHSSVFFFLIGRRGMTGKIPDRRRQGWPKHENNEPPRRILFSENISEARRNWSAVSRLRVLGVPQTRA